MLNRKERDVIIGLLIVQKDFLNDITKVNSIGYESEEISDYKEDLVNVTSAMAKLEKINEVETEIREIKNKIWSLKKSMDAKKNMLEDAEIRLAKLERGEE